MKSNKDNALFQDALRAILANDEDYIFIKDRALTCQAASAAFCGLLNCDSVEPLLGKTDYELFDKPLADKYHADDLAVIGEGKTISKTVERLPPKNGAEQWAQTKKFPIRAESGEIVGLCGIGRNITRRIELERDAKAASEFYCFILCFPGGIFIVLMMVV